MQSLSKIDLMSVAGGALDFKQSGPLLFIYVTGDSKFYNTGNFFGMTASIVLYADHAEDIYGTTLLTGKSECFHEGYSIYSRTIHDGHMYTFYHGVPK